MTSKIFIIALVVYFFGCAYSAENRGRCAGTPPVIAACMRAIDKAEEALSPSPPKTVPGPTPLGNLADEVSNAHSIAGRRRLSGVKDIFDFPWDSETLDALDQAPESDEEDTLDFPWESDILDAPSPAPDSDDHDSDSIAHADGPVMAPLPDQPEESQALNESADLWEPLYGHDVLEALANFFGDTSLEDATVSQQFVEQDAGHHDVGRFTSFTQLPSASTEADNSTKYELPERRNPGASPGDNQDSIVSTFAPPSSFGNFSASLAAAPPPAIISSLGMDGVLSNFGDILSKLATSPTSAQAPAPTSTAFRHRKMLDWAPVGYGTLGWPARPSSLSLARRRGKMLLEFITLEGPTTEKPINLNLASPRPPPPSGSSPPVASPQTPSPRPLQHPPPPRPFFDRVPPPPKSPCPFLPGTDPYLCDLIDKAEQNGGAYAGGGLSGAAAQTAARMP